MQDYENFVFYGSWREALEGFKEDFGQDYAKEVLWNLMLAATGGDIETDKKSIVNFIHGCCLPNIVAARDRYNKAVEGGKKGGRPRVQVDKEECLSLKKEFKTWKAVAAHYQIDEDTLRKIRKEWEEAEKPKNLYKDIYNDNDIYKDNETQIDIESSDCAADAAEITEAARRLGF